jgi:hypothetical protein
MGNENQERKEETKLLGEIQVIGVENMIIPQCCREGWDSCPHVQKKHKKTKTNIGL